MQREPAAGDDIRQTAVLLQKFVEIQIVVAYDEFNIHVWQLRLNIRCVGFVQVIGPQIYLNGLGIFLFPCLLCTFCAASGRQEQSHNQYHEHSKQAAQSSLVYQIVLLTVLEQLPFFGKAAMTHLSYTTARKSVLCGTRPRK